MHDETESSSGIRRPAEQERSDDAAGCRSEAEEQDSNKLMEELRVHQAELEMQNEELRCAQEALARSRDRFYSLFHQAPVGYVALDASGMIQEANEAFLRMAGAPREAVMGAYFHSLLEQSHASVFRGRFKALLKKPLGKEMEVRLLRQGKPLWIRIEASDGQAVDHPAGGEPPALLLILSDITEEKLAEEARREEQRRLNFVIEGSGLGTWEWNLQTNETVFNETWAEIIGYALDELTPYNLETWERLTHPEDLARARKALASCIAEETSDYECELRMRHKAGHWVWILDRGRVMTWDDHGRPLLMFGTHSDITPRKLMEEGRERLLERVTQEKRAQETLFEAAKTVLEGGDFASTARRIFDAARTLTGAQSGYVALLSDDGEENELLFLEAGGLPCLVNPDLPMPIRGLRAEAYKTGRVVSDNDFMHSRWASFMPPGHVDLWNVMFAPLNIEGKTVGIMGLANKPEDFNEDDVVAARAFGQLAAIALQKNRNLEALRVSEQRFRSFVENANDIEYALSPEGLFTYLSPNWIHFVGEPAEAALGRSFEPYVHPEDVHLCREFLQEVLCSGEKQSGVVYRVQRRDGTWRWHFSNGSPLFDSQGTLTGYLGIARDITEIRQAEETLKERERFLRAVLETTADGFFVLDNQGRITEANSAYCSMTGYRHDEIVGGRLRDIDADESPEETADRIKRVASRGSEIFETRHRRKDGTVFPVEISTSFVPTHGGRFVCFCRDLTERKENERILRRHSHLLENSPNAVYVSDEQGRLVYANTSAARQTGFAFSEIVGKHVWDIDASFTESEYVRFLSRMSSMNPVRLKTKHRRRDGSSFPVEISISKLVQEGSNLLCGIAVDITEREAREASLRRTQFTVDHAPIGVFWVSPEGEIIYANNKAADSLGYAKKELRGMEFECIDPNFPLPESESPWKLREREALMEFESIHRRKDGTVFPVYVHSHRISFMGEEMHVVEVQDITERKEREERIAVQGRMLDEAPASITIHGVDGRFFYANQASCTLHGYESEQEFLAVNLHKLDVPESEALLAERFRLIMEEGEARFEVCHYRKDGSSFPLEVLARAIQWEGKPAVLSIASDISDRKAAEDERDRLQTQLIQAQKMESVGRLAGGVAHDFNNMLGVILGHTEMALDETGPEEPIFSDLQEIHKAARRSSDLTRQLLAFARKQVISPRVLDLNETVEGMLKMLRRLIGEDIELAWLPGGRLWKVKMDPSQVDQILANLCVNARDAIAGHGRVTIETMNITLDEAQYEGREGLLPGEYVLLSVSDNGCGMDRNTLSHLFEPFFTTKGVGQGTGLGLATIYGIVKQNGGYIDVESEQGKGTRFSIHLPRHLSQAEADSHGKIKTAVERGSETILLVEDEDAMLKMAETMLKRLGYRVLACRAAIEAERLALEHIGAIHLLMTDVIMPEMNGRELAERLTSRYPNLRCLFTSGYTADVIGHHGVLNEGVHFIQKPFSRKDLAAKVREVLDQK